MTPVPSALARFVATARPLAEPATAEAAAAAFEDHLASSLAALADPGARASVGPVLAWARQQGVPAPDLRRTVPGHGDVPLAPDRAALVAGLQAHVLDLDDTHEMVRGHATAVLVPTLLALAEPDTPVPDLLAAYVVGLEVMARMGAILDPDHYRAGWHATGTLGPVGGAAAGAHLLGTDQDATARALSLAASRSGGVRTQFGTAAKPLHAGIAAASAVQSVQWARIGFPAAMDAVTGPNGLLAAFGLDEAARDRVFDRAGDPWAILSPGLWVKQFPFCSAAMALGDAAAQIADRIGATDDRDGDADGSPVSRAALIDQVEIRFRPGADAALVHRVPRTGEEGRFSAEYVCALRLLGITPDLSVLGSGPVDPTAAQLARRITRSHVPADASDRSVPTGARDVSVQVRVRMSDGTVLDDRVSRPLGAPGRPLPDDARHDKLVRALSGDTDRAQRLHRALRREDTTMSALTGLLT